MKINSYMPKQGKKVASLVEVHEILPDSCEGCTFFCDSECILFTVLQDAKKEVELRGKCSNDHIIYKLKGVKSC